MTAPRTKPDSQLPENHLGYAPAYHLARLHRASGTLCWCVAGALIIGWLVALPSFGPQRPIANFAVLLAMLFLLLPWSVAVCKSAWRLTDRWPQPSRPDLLGTLARTIAILGPILALCFGVILVAIRLGLPPIVIDPNRPLALIAWQGAPLLTMITLTTALLGFIILWLRAGLLIPRAAVGRNGSTLARLRIGIGLLVGIVGVLVLVGLDLLVRLRFGEVNFIETVVLLVAGMLCVLFAWTFGALHARLTVLVGAIERAEDDLRRQDRNRLGVLSGDASMNESSATPERGPDRSQDEIGPIGNHPDPPGL
ncbi:MAG: hypothetical protein ACIAQF_05405 [Phycisphaerales bacterium JB065]